MLKCTMLRVLSRWVHVSLDDDRPRCSLRPAACRSGDTETSRRSYRARTCSYVCNHFQTRATHWLGICADHALISACRISRASATSSLVLAFPWQLMTAGAESRCAGSLGIPRDNMGSYARSIKANTHFEQLAAPAKCVLEPRVCCWINYLFIPPAYVDGPLHLSQRDINGVVHSSKQRKRCHRMWIMQSSPRAQ